MSNAAAERVERIRVIATDHIGRLTETVREILDADGNVAERIRTLYEHPLSRTSAPNAVPLDLQGVDSLWAFTRRAVVAQGTHAGTDIAPVVKFLDEAKVRLQIASDNETLLRLP
jgi:hypothetical protein